MKSEIDRKFLVKSLPDLSECKSSRIVQCYIELTEHTERRVRRIDDEYYLTSKSGLGLVREEKEENITAVKFSELSRNSIGNIVEKTRYYMNLGVYLIEIDIYESKLKGLITAEVEFESESESKNFTPPEWFGA